MRVDCDVRNLSLCGKIFVTQEVPSNEIFGICASLFAIGMPIWMMASGFVEEKTSRYAKLISITKYIYAPFILLEIYSMSVRVKAYGLTEQRYAAIMFILLQIIYILWNRHYENLILVFVGCLLIGLLLPFGNASYLSYQSQKNRFVKNQTSDKEVAAEAYDYLRGNAYGRRYIKTNLTEAEQDELHNMLYDRDSEDQWKSVYFNAYPIEEGGLTIRGYEKSMG